MYEVAAVILAAGSSSRMGENKLLLPLGPSTLFNFFLEHFPYSLFHQVIVVFADLDVGRIAANYPVICCRNKNQQAGKSHSIHLGVNAVTANHGIMFFVADQPLLQQKTIKALLTAFYHNPTHITFPEHNGRPGNPVIFPAHYLRELNQLKGDSGGKEIIASHREMVQSVTCQEPIDFFDIDTPENYRKLQQLWIQRT